MPKSGFDLRQKVFYAEFRFIWNWGCPLLCRGPAPSSTKGKHIKGTQLRCTQFNFPPHPHAATMSTILSDLARTVKNFDTISLLTTVGVTILVNLLIYKICKHFYNTPSHRLKFHDGKLKKVLCCLALQQKFVAIRQLLQEGHTIPGVTRTTILLGTVDTAHGYFFFSFSSLTPSTYLL